MLSKLKEIEKRYDELSALLCDSAVISDSKRYASLSKEQADMQEIVEKYREYCGVLLEYEEAKAEAERETGEMKELFLSEAFSCKQRIDGLVSELKVLRSLPIRFTACIWGIAKNTVCYGKLPNSTRRNSAESKRRSST